MTGQTADVIPSEWRDAVSDSLPRWWIGFILAGAIVLVELAWLVFNAAGLADLEEAARYTVIGMAMTGSLFWLYCVYALHWRMALATNGMHPVTGFAAAVGHLIPLYNLYWVFKWPNEMASTVNQRLSTGHVPRHFLGLLILLGIMARAWDSALALFVLFGVGTYLNRKIAATLRFPAIPAPPPVPPVPEAQQPPTERTTRLWG